MEEWVELNKHRISNLDMRMYAYIFFAPSKNEIVYSGEKSEIREIQLVIKGFESESTYLGSGDGGERVGTQHLALADASSKL